MGGLGLQDANMVNKALLAKHSSRILDKPNSIVSSRVRNKYLVPHSNFQFKMCSKASLAWRGISRNSHFITDHLRWRLECGDHGDIHSKYCSHHISSPPSRVLVTDLLNHNSYDWDMDKINIVCLEDEVNHIIVWPHPIRGRPYIL